MPTFICSLVIMENTISILRGLMAVRAVKVLMQILLTGKSLELGSDIGLNLSKLKALNEQYGIGSKQNR